MQPDEPKTISNSIINKLIAKLHGIKKSHSKVSIVDLLEPTKYFKKLIYDKAQRREFLEEASPYLKLKFFPKGTVINEYKTDDVKFSIVVEGKIALYAPRTSEEIWNDHRNQHLSQIIEYYVEYIRQRKTMEKTMKAQQTNNDSPRGKKKITKMMTLSKIKEMAIQTAQAQPTATGGSLVDIATAISSQGESILPDFLLEYDLTVEEKLLLLPHYNNLQDIVKNGRLIFKHVGCIASGDMFGETSLLRPLIASNTMVALDDVYLAHLTRSDFEKIYSTEGIANVKEKLQFLEKMFPSLGDESRIRLACFLEERVFSLREVLFREGTEADEIYMIKSGEVELLFYDKNVKNKTNNSPTPRSNQYEKTGNTKINISKLQSGSIFGEEEVVHGANRKYSAIVHQTNTFLYVLKKEIYSIFNQTYPEIANAFKDWITVKKTWRDNKIQKELDEEDDDSFGIENKEKSMIKHKKQARLSIFKTDPDEPIHERLRKKQSIIKIQASVGFKAPYKSNADYDIAACASPHYQEKRISTLDLQNLNLFGLVSPVAQKIKPITFSKNSNAPENLSTPAIKSLSPIIRPKDEIELQKSNLFLFNQKRLNEKSKACKTSRNDKKLSIKLAPIVKRSPSQVDFKSSLNQIPETLTETPDLKKSLQLKLYGGLSTRLPKEETPIISLPNSPNMKPKQPARLKKGLKPISLAQVQTMSSSIGNLDTEADFKPYHFSSILASPAHQRSTTLFNILDSKFSDTSGTDTQNSPSNSKITQSWNPKPRSVFFVK